MIIVVMGLPGSGKSYFASRLAEKLGAEYVNSDRLRKDLFPNRSYSEFEKSKVYEVLLEKMEAAVSGGKKQVLDATFHTNKVREPFIVKSKGAITFIEVRAEEDLIKGRLKEKRLFSEADYGVYQLIRQQWEPMARPHLTLQSTNYNTDAMLKEAVQYLADDTKTDQ